MNSRPILEAINSPKQDIDGIRNALYDMHKLARVFTRSKDDSRVYRENAKSATLKFPPSLASVIYAAFHRNDDPEYFDLIAEAVTGDIARSYNNPGVKNIEAHSGYRYDPASSRIDPFGRKGTPELRKEQAVSSQKLSDYDESTVREARDTVVGILTNPERIKSIGAKFGEYLYDLVEHIEDTRNSAKLLGDLGNMMDTYRKQYVNELVATKPLSAVEYDQDGKPIERYLRPKAVGFSYNGDGHSNDGTPTISDAEIYAYIACRMSENYGSGIMEHSLEAKNAAEEFREWEKLPEPKSKFRDYRKTVTDTVEYVRDWIEAEGLPDETEHQTGEGRSEYLALDISNPDLDLSGAPVAPQYLTPLFAKDCARFMKKRKGVRIKGTKEVTRGYKMMAELFGVPIREKIKDENGKLEPDEQYNEYMRNAINAKIAELTRDVGAAVDIHDQAVAKLKKNPDDPVSANILTQVFQGNKSPYTGISGAGNETMLRKTGVERGNITTRILSAVKRFPGKYKVLSDNKTKGNLTIKLGDDIVNIASGDTESADNYVMPVLFPYIDSTESFTTYTIWRGIVPYTRMSDNKMEYMNDEGSELHDARVYEGGDIASGAISSLNDRNPAVNLIGRGTFNFPNLSKEELAKTLPPIKKDQAFTNTQAVEEFDEKTLHAYSIIANIEAYDSVLKQYIGNKVSTEDGLGAPAVRFAVMDVYGSIPTMVSDVSNNELRQMVAERAKEYAAVISANGLDVNSSGKNANNTRKLVRSYDKEFATDLFTALNRNIPAEISTAYDNDEHDTLVAFRKLLQDLCGAAYSMASGYGYHGIDVTGTYSGGKYDDGNRISVSFNPDGDTEPIGRFHDTAVIDAQRKTEREIVRTTNVILDAATFVSEHGRNAGLAKESAKLLDRLNVDESAKTSLREMADAAIVRQNGKYTELGKVYSILYSVLTNLIVRGPVTESVKPWLMSGGNTANIDEAMRNLGKQATLPKLEKLRPILRELTGNGALINELTDAFRGSDIGDSGEHAAYSELVSAAIGAVEGAKNLDDLKARVKHFFHTSPRKMSDVGEDDTVSLDDVGYELEAPDENQNGVGEMVANNFKNWKLSNDGTYRGLTDKMGFDTIRVGNTSGGIGSMTPLKKESAFSGLNEDAVQKCADYIQSAQEDLQEFEAKHGTEIANIGVATVRKLWADYVIDYIGTKYMNSDGLRLKFRHTPEGVVVDDAAGEEWRKLVEEVVTGLKSMCSDRYMPPTAAMRKELEEFLTNVLAIGTENTLSEISKVSTAFAHIILRVGDIAKDVATPNPYAGSETPMSDIPEAMRDVAKQRSVASGDNDTTTSSRESLNLARDSVIGDDNLRRELESIYDAFGMDFTEGYDRKLDQLAAGKHAANNKTHKADDKKKQGFEPNTATAAAYGAILDDESAGNKNYKQLVSQFTAMAQTDPMTTLGNLIEKLALNVKIANGPFSGQTYAELAFGEHLGKLSGLPISRILKNQGVIGGLVKAIRYRLTDRLLSNSTYGPMKKNNPEMMDRISETFFNLAGNLASGHAATICAVLDPAERNAGHEAYFNKMTEDLNADATTGAQSDSDEYIKNQTGDYPERGIKADGKLADAVTKIMKAQVEKDPDKCSEMKDEGFKELDEIGGPDAVAYIRDELDNNPYVKRIIADAKESVNGRHSLNQAKKVLIDRIVYQLGSKPRELYKAGAQVDVKEAQIYAHLASAICDIYKYQQIEAAEDRKKTAMKKRGEEYAPNTEVAKLKQRAIWGVNYVNDVLGAKSEQFIVNNMRLLDESNGEPREVIANALEQMRTSKSSIPDTIMDYAKQNGNSRNGALRGLAQEMEKNIGKPKMPSVGSVNEQNRRMRSLGGAHGVSAITQANSESFDALMKAVQKRLNGIDVPHMDTLQMRMLHEELKSNAGFTGSIDKFCKDVKMSGRSQASLAADYAHDGENYDMAALRKYLRSSIGAVSIDAGKTPMGGSIDEGTIRLIARSEIPGIRMATDSDGREYDQIQIGNGKYIPVDSPDAHMQMTLIINRAERELGHSVFTKDGNIAPDSKKVLAEIVKGNTAPIDPMVATKQLVPVVIGIIQRSIQNDAGVDTGKQWAKVTKDGDFLREYTEQDGNKFVAKFSEGKIASIVQGVVGSAFSDVTQNAVREEIRQYLTQKKGTVEGGLNELEKKIKDDITKEIKRCAHSMVKNQVTRMSKNNLVVTWENPPRDVTRKNGIDIEL